MADPADTKQPAQEGADEPEVNLEEVDAEVREDAAPEADEPEAGAPENDEPAQADEDQDGAFWTMVEEGIGAPPEEANETLLSQMKAETLSKLPPEARAIIKQVQAKAKKKVASAEAKLAEREAGLAKREASIEAARKDLFRRQAQLSSFMNTPEVQALVNAAKADTSGVDAFTPDGARTIAETAAAKAAMGVLGPMVDAAAKQEQRLKWDDFVTAHPKLMDKRKDATGKTFYEQFKHEVEAGGKDWDGAYNAVLAAQYHRQEDARRKAEQAARADSARRVRRDAAGGDPGKAHTSPPPEVVKQGGAAVAAWWKSHPRASQSARRGA